MPITKEVWKRKLDEKIGYDVPLISRAAMEDNPKTKREMHELQHKSKPCICGLHSIKAYKEKTKYPIWKKKSRKKNKPP